MAGPHKARNGDTGRSNTQSVRSRLSCTRCRYWYSSGKIKNGKGEFDFDLHAARRIDYIGVTFRTRTLDEVRELSQAMQADLWGAVEAGEFNLPIDREFALDDAKAAVDYMKSNQHFGKIILNVAS